MKYQKPPLTYEQQVDLLISRKLIIPNRQEAINILKRISYFRLYAYCYPLQKQTDVFNPGTTIENIKRIYTFDHNLQILIFNAIKIIEVAFRTSITYHLSHAQGAFSYLDKKHFTDSFANDKYDSWLNSIKKGVQRSKETFIEHYKQKYTGTKDIPIWMLTEIISFGQLSLLYSGLLKEDKKAIADRSG